MRPWEMEKDQVEILVCYDAKIIGEGEKNTYEIEFFDYDSSVVWARMRKNKFDSLPYPVSEGTLFWIVVCKTEEHLKATAQVWPVAKFWHPSWREDNE